MLISPSAIGRLPDRENNTSCHRGGDFRHWRSLLDFHPCPSLWSHTSAAGNKTFDHLMSGAADLKAGAFARKRKTKLPCWNCPSLSVRTIRDLIISIVYSKRFDPKRFRNHNGNSC